MKKLAKIVCAVLAAAMTVVTVAGCGGSSSSFKAETINIGCSGPLTGSAAMYGVAVNNSAKMAVEEINAAGGLDGIKFAFEMMDDQAAVTAIPNNYASLMDQGMQISLGTVTTGSGMSWKGELENDNLFCLTPSATGDSIADGQKLFQMCFADSDQGTLAAAEITEIMTAESTRKLGIFYKSDDEYSTGIVNKFKAAFSGTITAEQSFTNDTAEDFNTAVQALSSCDLLFMPIYYTPAALFITTGIGVIPDNAIYYGCDGFDGIAEPLANRMNEIPQKISFLSHFDSTATDGAQGTYITKYRNKYGANAPLNQFGASAYDCVYAIFNALKAAKQGGATVNASLTPAQFNTILNAQFNGTGTTFKFTGITGTDISWNAEGKVVKTPVECVVKEANTVA